MMDKDMGRGICEKILSASKANQTEILIYSNDAKLTRFADSEIHQNVAESESEVRIRVVLEDQGKRIGVASTNQLDEHSLKETLERAIELARFQPENPEFVSLPGPLPFETVASHVERTVRFGAEERAAVAGTVCRKALENKLIASGAFLTAERGILVANSLGTFAHHRGTCAEFSTVVMGEDSSGYADYLSLDAGEVDGEKLALEAIQKALASRNPLSVEPGKYTVFLEEYAVNELLNYLAYPGFGAQSFQDGSGFMAGKLEQRITGEKISLWDDGQDPSGLALPFDFEGVPKEKVFFLENGIARRVAYDSFTANKSGNVSTGHALPAPNPDGPTPINMFMRPGNTSKEEMLKGIEKGLWITRFHYVNHISAKESILTGMTRDGTFLIEGGKVTRPI
ncbi:MAG TPA: TldD/PmbA family protein, partial [Chroococcales cyanobacterium]